MTGPLFPANYSRVWIQGSFVDLTGNAMTGQVTFTPSPALLLDLAPKLIISGKVFAAQLDLHGRFQVQVPCTDDPDITPTGWTYKVVEPTGRSYNIEVPMGTPVLAQNGHPLNGQRVIDLIDVVPTPTPNSGTVQLMSGRGITGSHVNNQGHLVFDFTDGTSQDVGHVDGYGGSVRSLTDSPTASGAISGHRVVAPLSNGSVAYADSSNPALVHAPLWVTSSAASSGAPVDVVMQGSVVEPTWSWTVGAPVFLGANGALTQTAPSSPAFVAQVGVATSATSVFVDRQPSLVLA